MKFGTQNGTIHRRTQYSTTTCDVSMTLYLNVVIDKPKIQSFLCSEPNVSLIQLKFAAGRGGGRGKGEFQIFTKNG